MLKQTTPFLAAALLASPAFGVTLISDDFDVTGGNSGTTGFGVDEGVNFEIATRLTGTVADSTALSWFEQAGRDPANASIVGDKFQMGTIDPGEFPFRMTLTENGTDAFDFSSALGADTATALAPVTYTAGITMANTGGLLRQNFGIANAPGAGAAGWDVGVQLFTDGGALEVYLRIDGGSHSGTGDINQLIHTFGGALDQEVEFTIDITDAGNEVNPDFSSSFTITAETTTETFVYDSLTEGLEWRFNNQMGRYFFLDTAPGTSGTFDDFFVENDAAPLVPGDADGDGDVDDTDLGIAISNFTGPGGTGKTLADGDTDGDGDVDDTDLGIAISGFTGPLSPAAVPEPTSLALLTLGGLLAARRRRG